MLELKLGSVNLGTHPSGHQFVVDGHDNVATIHVGRDLSHTHLYESLGIDEARRVGGGDLRLGGDSFTLESASMNYGGIPEDAAEGFAPLILEELQKSRPAINRYTQSVIPYELHEFWRHKLSKFKSPL